VDPAALNLTTKPIGYGRLLFVHLDSAAGLAVAERVDAVGAGLENVHDVDGVPSADASRSGRFPAFARGPEWCDRRVGHAALMWTR
jgi:hypothetical protein